MSSPHLRRFRALVMVAFTGGALSACSRSEATPASQGAQSGGEISAASAGVGTSLTDSVSVRADRGRIRGADGAQVWLIEISDFQCPYCKRFHDEVFETIDREYVQTGKIRHAFINFPLSSIHRNARGASEAAMCASAQGRFWELHDSLFDTQARWGAMANPAALFDSLAVAAKVDPAPWRSCMSAHATASLIDADKDRSARAGVKSTPSFFIGNRGLVGTYPVDSFRVVIDAALGAARGAR